MSPSNCAAAKGDDGVRTQSEPRREYGLRGDLA